MRLAKTDLLQRFHLDGPLLGLLVLLFTIGLMVLYSASGRELIILQKQGFNFCIGLLTLVLIAQIPPRYFYTWAPWLYLTGSILLIAVLVMGDAAKGAQRWLEIGPMRFQPSELMKIAVPLMLGYYLNNKVLPPRRKEFYVAVILIAFPVLLIAKQPDLGTAILIGASGAIVLFLAGISRQILINGALMITLAIPALWYVMHDYQKQRILTFLHPEQDPLGSGYHIIQSKIAIGSGGVWGKGYLEGTQSKLDFLPEGTTDFIFSIFSEEFGFIGIIGLFIIYASIVARSMYLGQTGQDTFSRLVAGTMALIFSVYVFVNVGMVSGLLPVVGVPLPLVSYGGTSLVTLLAGFGIIMSVYSHRRLLSG